MMRRCTGLASGMAALLSAFTPMASAQPTTSPEPAPAPMEAGALAQVKDEQALAEALSAITQDPAIPIDDPALRTLAQALMTEGIRQLQTNAYDQALANFLEAYAKFPSPKILLNVASTLRDMGRLADAANTYQRYLLDPATGVARVAEVKELLLKLDEQLTILTVRVIPRGSDVSIDGGPFLAVGSSLQTRVRAGIHLVRVRHREASSEITVNGFEGENKEVIAEVAVPPPEDSPAPAEPVDPKLVVIQQRPPKIAPSGATLAQQPPEHVVAWLTTGTQYGTDGTERGRKVRAGFNGPEVSALIPTPAVTDQLEAEVVPRDEPRLTVGVLGVARIDGQLRGAAGGMGLAFARGRVELGVMVLRSAQTGGYLGGRFSLLTGLIRPYLAAGVPGFIYDQATETEMGTETATKLALGVRGAAGIELAFNPHLSLHADVGYEHFFGVEDTIFEPDVFVPTLAVVGRL